MKLFLRIAWVTATIVLWLAGECRAQTSDELEASGVAHFKKGYYDALPKKNAVEAADEFWKAETALRKAIKQSPDRVSAYLHLGRTLFVQEKYQEAAEIYAAALKIDPGNKPVYLQLASAREMAGDYIGAVGALEQLRAMEDDPQALRMIDDLIDRMRTKR
jgi:tetratricopeptide (TPR) repeat protein